MKSQKPIQSSTPAEIATIASSIAMGFRWGDGLAVLVVWRMATKPRTTPPTRTHISTNAQNSGLVKAWRALLPLMGCISQSGRAVPAKHERSGRCEHRGDSATPTAGWVVVGGGCKDGG